MRTVAKSVCLGRRVSCQCRGKCNTKFCLCTRSGHSCTSGCHSKIKGNCKNSKSPQKSSSNILKKTRDCISTLPINFSKNSGEILSEDCVQIIGVSTGGDSDNKLSKCIEISKSLKNQSFLDIDSSDSESLDDLIIGMGRSNVSFADLEQFCVSWGGCYQGVNMCNTCSIDNFLTLISLHLYQLQRLLISLETTIKDDLRKILAYIHTMKFDSLRFWLAKKIIVTIENNEIDFFGSEYNIVQMLVNVGLSMQKYECTFKCPNCLELFIIKERISYFTTFLTNFQTTIESKLIPERCNRCHWKDMHFEQVASKFPQLSPLLFIETGNLQVNEYIIDPYIKLKHEQKMLTFRHIGHTLIYGNHFTLKTFLDEQFVSYDGIRNPKIQIELPSKFPESSKINFVAFLLVLD